MQENKLKRVVYISRFAQSLGEAEIRQIGRLSQRNNERDGVTGVLLASAGTFFQVLEGPAEAVDTIYTRILRDPRHEDIICLSAEDGPGGRMFPGWSMETVDLEAVERGIALPVQAMLASLEQAYRIIDRYTQPRVSRMIVEGVNPLSVPPQRVHKLVLSAAIDDAGLAVESLSSDDVVLLLDTFADVCGRRIALAGGEIFRIGGAEVLAAFPPDRVDEALECLAGIDHELASTVEVEAADSPLRHLEASFGLARGMVVEGNIGSSLKKEFTIVGAAVQAAMALRARATRDRERVLLTAEVRDEALRAWALESVGTETLGGLTRPVALYRLDTRARRPAPAERTGTGARSGASTGAGSLSGTAGGGGTTAVNPALAERSLRVAAVPAPSTGPLADEDDAAPRRLGRYELVEPIGAGSAGCVYLARDPAIGRKLAIKTFVPPNAVDAASVAEARRRFLKEAEMAGRLNHPNIIAVYDCGEDADTAWIAMELVDGFDLSRHARPDTLMAPAAALKAVGQVSRALHYAHARSVIHQDIKPANLLVASRRVVKVSDFGIARASDAVRADDGEIRGTPAFMSPEQVQGLEIDHRSDLFSLGVTLYVLLTGHRPFDAKTFPGFAEAICGQPHPDPRSYRPELPEAVVALLDRALAKRRGDRFANAAELMHAVSGALRALPAERARGVA